MHKIRNIFLSALLLVSAHLSKAQGVPQQDSLLLRYNTFATWFAPEKVYLHVDRTCYTAGETIWFKGWVQEASPVSGMQPSNFMYVELLDRSGDAIQRVKLKRTETGFPGYLEIPDILETGDYTIRAYTLWQLNSDDEYLFNDKIRIIGGSGKKDIVPEAPRPTVKISFWPEGGRYFADRKSVIGFKAVDGLGRSTDLSGDLVDDMGNVLRPVFTIHDGMGVFDFLPKPGRSYGVRDASGKIHPIPQPSEEGGTLQLWSISDKYCINAMGLGGGTASVLLRDPSRIVPLAEIGLDGEKNLMVVNRAFFYPGINHLLLVDSGGRILAERLFFIRDDEAPLCSLDNSGTISLSAPDGTPLDGNCSVSVVRGLLKDWQQSDGITSYLPLSSELGGRINNPYYYFDPDIPLHERNAALDALMMIQGWRYYPIEKILDPGKGKIRLRHKREYMQEVRGFVSRWASSRMPRRFTFTFMIPKMNVMESLNVDRGNRFIIDSLDFPENTEFLINIGTSRFGAVYLPKWEGDAAADSHIYKPAPGSSKDSWLTPPLENLAASGDTLQAAVVTAEYSDSDVLVFGRSYRDDLIAFKDQTLVEYLSTRQALFEYDGEHMYNRSRMRFSVASPSDDDPDDEMFGDGDDDRAGRVKLIVEDTEQAWWSYDMLRLGDLRSLSVSTRPDPVYGGDGGVVHITVKPGGMRTSQERNPSLLYFMPLGYQRPRGFEPAGSDLSYVGPAPERNTILWSPDVTIHDGRGVIDLGGGKPEDYPCVVRIEGLTASGRPFSRHCTITP